MRNPTPDNYIEAKANAPIGLFALLGFTGLALYLWGAKLTDLTGSSTKRQEIVPIKPSDSTTIIGSVSPSTDSKAQRVSTPYPNIQNTDTVLKLDIKVFKDRVHYEGVLFYTDPKNGKLYAIDNASVDFNDPLKQETFYTARTDLTGGFTYDRPIRDDEKSGYNVNAYYDGGILYTGGLTGPVGSVVFPQAVTGVWYVEPK